MTVDFRQGRLLITGNDDAGRSCVVEEVALGSQSAEGGFSAMVAYTGPPGAPPTSAPGTSDHLEIGLPPGQVQWMIVDYEPGQSFPMHFTRTIDLDTVLRGSVELELADGVHPLGVGDCVMIPGIDHAWKAGDGGCRLGVTFIGTHAT
jgi:quercetin dioxygenase-like cupin family protein